MIPKDSDSHPPFNPYFALAIGTFAVSTGAIFARLAEAPALVIAASRVGIAALILAPIAWWKARDELLKLSGRDLKLAVLSGFFLARRCLAIPWPWPAAYALPFICFWAAIYDTTCRSYLIFLFATAVRR